MGQLRKKAQQLSRQARNGDRAAAQELLRHSVETGHGKLALHRFFLASAMGAEVRGDLARYCADLMTRIPSETVRKIAQAEAANARLYLQRGAPDA
ncbi:hypothetical protein DWF04_019880 [Cereibacter sphaeroides f. sp. denitrificans]|nr:hypothetical protein DWF04_11900 [Cereibacter sphaeroides f. sp. denitrificans]